MKLISIVHEGADHIDWRAQESISEQIKDAIIIETFIKDLGFRKDLHIIAILDEY